MNRTYYKNDIFYEKRCTISELGSKSGGSIILREKDHAVVWGLQRREDVFNMILAIHGKWRTLK